MTGKKEKLGLVLAAAVLMGSTLAHALPIIEQQNGDSDAFTGWDIEGRYQGDPDAGAQSLDTVDGETAVEVNADTAGEFVPQTDVIFTEASNLAGNLNYTDGGVDPLEVTQITFDFFAGRDGDNTGSPDALTLYLQTGGSAVWFYNFNTADIDDGWNSYAVNLSYGSGWTGFDDNTLGAGTRDGTDFATDMLDVDRLGFSIQYAANIDGQQYAFDDIALHSPEPETYLVLAVALLSLAVVFRKKIKESLAEARTVMNA